MRVNETCRICCVEDSGDDGCWTLIESPEVGAAIFRSAPVPASPLESTLVFEPSARPTSTLRSSSRPDTRTRQGLQQTSQSWTKLPLTSGST